MTLDELNLKPSCSVSASAAPLSNGGWRLEIPSGPEGQYRLSQLDDYWGIKRDGFQWQVPVRLSMTARVSSTSIPGTWGFGLWNDPFSLSLGFGGGSRRFPMLPNTAWFFFASPQNYLSLRDDVPAQGFLVQTFRSLKVPSILLGLGVIGYPLMVSPRIARVIRRVLRNFVRDDSYELTHDVTDWHKYSLAMEEGRVTFQVDDAPMFSTEVIPAGRLGIVIWIDNQYLSFKPDGRLSYGTLACSETAWLEIRDIEVARIDDRKGNGNNYSDKTADVIT